MPYLIDASDRAGAADLRQATRPRHLRFVEENLHRLLAAGAKLDEDGVPTGTFYILDSESRAEAEDFIAADPYAAEGVFGRTSIMKWRKGFFNFARADARPAEARP